MNLLGFFHTEKPKKNFFEQPNNQKPKTKKLNKSHFQGFVNSQYFFMKYFLALYPFKTRLSHNLWLWFSWRSSKKIQNGRLKKNSFSSSANSQYFFMKISWIGPWVSRIDWCEGHWFVSTFVAVRLSDISSKTGKKCIFGVFRVFLSLCQTASQPQKLRQTNALCINQFY